MPLIEPNKPEAPSDKLKNYRILHRLRHISDEIVKLNDQEPGYNKGLTLQRLKATRETIKAELPKFQVVT